MNKCFNRLMKLSLAVLGGALLAVSCNPSGGDHDKISEDSVVAKLKVPADFHAERLYTPTDHEQGSWVAMTFDDKGRIIACDQYGYLYRVTVPAVGADTASEKIKVEKLEINMPGDTSPAKIKMGLAHGLLYAFNSLYVTVNDEGEADTLTRPSGVYRLQDTDGDDQFDKITLLKRLKGAGEHGPHSVVLSPDKQSLYIVAGNFTDLPAMDNYRLPATWKNDNLLPFLPDPNGFGNNQPPPGGWIARTDPEGKSWELIATGFRNPFDIAFNEDGELFTYDSDMEWDMGLPWYRPTRICHVTSGSDFGYRENNGKYSPAYTDNLPAILNIGPGSPTNVMSGAQARFPEQYRRGLFAFDWSYGTMYHVALQPEGSSYKANVEEFISGSPLPLTDGAIGPDGALYFLTGGRKINSNLFRVYYGNNDGKDTALTADQSAAAARHTRQQLEAFQGKPDKAAIEMAWPLLNSNDRFIQYAARIAVEHQPVSEWQQKALAETDPAALTQAMLALARNGAKSQEGAILDKLLGIDYQQLSPARQTDLLRTMEVTLSRMGMPDESRKAKIISQLGPQYPAEGNILNRLLSKVLAYAGDPQIVSKTLALIDRSTDNDTLQKMANQSSSLLDRNPQYGKDVANMIAKQPPAQQIYLAIVLSDVKNGWTPETREKYFKLYPVFFGRKGGNSYVGYIEEARKKALSHVPKNDLAHYTAISENPAPPEKRKRRNEGPKGPGREWTLDDAVKTVQDNSGKRSFGRGKMLFNAILCGSCHTIHGEGQSVGPDLTQLGTRFGAKDILESIINPSKEISDQYAATKFTLKDGHSVSGRLIRQDAGKYYVSDNPFAPLTLREIPKKEVASKKLSDVSVMLPGLINPLSPDELRDLMAYLMAGGDKDNKIYTSKK